MHVAKLTIPLTILHVNTYTESFPRFNWVDMQLPAGGRILFPALKATHQKCKTAKSRQRAMNTENRDWLSAAPKTATAAAWRTS